MNVSFQVTAIDDSGETSSEWSLIGPIDRGISLSCVHIPMCSLQMSSAKESVPVEELLSATLERSTVSSNLLIRAEPIASASPASWVSPAKRSV